LRAQDRVIAVCNSLRTSTYVNAIGGKSLYDHVGFEKNGLELKFLRPHLDGITYKQFCDPFIPGLSIVDLLMFNPSQEVHIFLEAYSLED
jgi:hypothetical protein